MNYAGAAATNRPKVFLSYASASRERVGVLATALEAEGFEVWWDHALVPGDDYRQKIETALAACNVAVVAWTPAATGSDWVISESDDARNRGILVPVQLQACALPKPFDRLHTANLTKWTGNRAAPEFQTLAEALRARAEGRAPKRTAWRRRLFTLGGASAFGGLALAGVLNFAALSQFVSGIVNPAASERTVAATSAKLDEVLALLKSESAEPLEPASEAALRESIARLLSAQDGARKRAADKLASGDRDGALAELQSAAERADSANAKLAETYKEIGALAFPDRTADAIAAYARAVELAPGDAEARNQLGHLYLRAGNLDKAEAAYRHILDTIAAPDESWQAPALGNLGNVAFRRGRLDEAENFSIRALALHEKLGSLEGQAIDLSNLGNVAFTRGRLDEAEAFHTRALALNEKLGRPEGQAANLGNLGRVALAHGRLDEAEAFLTRALALNEKLGRLEGQAINLENLGLVAEKRGDLPGGIAYWRRALALYRQMGAAPMVEEVSGWLRAAGADPDAG